MQRVKRHVESDGVSDATMELIAEAFESKMRAAAGDFKERWWMVVEEPHDVYRPPA